MKKIWFVLRDSFNKWRQDDVIEYSAALAYFTIFSLAPLLIIAVAIAGIIYGRSTAQERLMAQLNETVGGHAADFIRTMLVRASQTGHSLTATLIGIATLLVGAMRIFGELKKMLNRIWGIQPPQGGVVRSYLREYLFSFLMVLLVGFLLLAMIVISTLLTSLNQHLGNQFGGIPYAWEAVNMVTSFVVVTLLFAMIYKILPDVSVLWSDVWHGAIIAGVLFTLGKYLIGLYLGRGSVASPYGAAGSLVIVLIFFYYSALILFFGAEFTAVYSLRLGSRRQAGAQTEPCAPVAAHHGGQSPRRFWRHLWLPPRKFHHPKANR